MRIIYSFKNTFIGLAPGRDFDKKMATKEIQKIKKNEFSESRILKSRKVKRKKITFIILQTKPLEKIWNSKIHFLFIRKIYIPYTLPYRSRNFGQKNIFISTYTRFIKCALSFCNFLLWFTWLVHYLILKIYFPKNLNTLCQIFFVLD